MADLHASDLGLSDGYSTLEIFQRMLDYLPPCFNVDPVKQPAFTVSHPTQQVQFTIQGFVFQLWLGGGFTPLYTAELRNYTIEELTEELSGLSGLVVAGVNFPDKSALRLLPTENDTSGEVYVFTNPVYALHGAMALELMDAQAALRECIRQMTIVGANTFVQDFWGLFANVARNPGEFDLPYGQRILVEFKVPKDNNFALEVIINTIMGLDVSVVDLGSTQSQSTMYMNDVSTPIQNPAFDLWNYSATQAMFYPCCFGVFLNDTPLTSLTADQLKQLKNLILTYKAAGTSPALVGEGSIAGMLMNDTSTPVYNINYPLEPTYPGVTVYQAFGNKLLIFIEGE